MQTIRYCPAILLTLAFLVPLTALWGAGKTAKEYLVYFGTFTDKDSKGIYMCRFHPGTGKLTPVELATETVSPTFLAVDPTLHYLFSTNEIGDYNGARSGSVTSFAIDRHSGKLTTLNTVASRGGSPCHLAVYNGSKHVLVANYGGGSVAVLPVAADGKLSEASDFKQHLGSGAARRRQRDLARNSF